MASWINALIGDAGTAAGGASADSFGLRPKAPGGGLLAEGDALGSLLRAAAAETPAPAGADSLAAGGAYGEDMNARSPVRKTAASRVAGLLQQIGQRPVGAGGGMGGGFIPEMAGQQGGGLMSSLGNVRTAGQLANLLFGGGMSGPAALGGAAAALSGGVGSAGTMLGSQLGVGGLFGPGATGAVSPVVGADVLGGFSSLLGPTYGSGAGAAAGAGGAAGGASSGAAASGIGAAALPAGFAALAALVGAGFAGLLDDDTERTPEAQQLRNWLGRPDGGVDANTIPGYLQIFPGESREQFMERYVRNANYGNLKADEDVPELAGQWYDRWLQAHPEYASREAFSAANPDQRSYTDDA